MEHKKKILVNIALVLCLVATALFGHTTEAQAASYKKTITKTVTLKRGQQCAFMMDTKAEADGTVKVKINVSGKFKKDTIQAVMPSNSWKNSNGYLKSKKATFGPERDVTKGTTSIYVSNYGSGTVKVKITVTSKKANLKYKSCQKMSAEG